MAMTDSDEIFFVYENRLASFQIPHPIENSGPEKPKVLNWPHKTLSPVAFAKAGFFFEPYLKSPDNVVCFLCDKSLDGWEEHDNPLEEHLKHSPTCGWAIMAAIEADMGNYGKVHPLDPFIIEARKATFAGRWPYESKKGFKCKTKKLVEAGWKYTPSREADDMATCAYCQLALEGWESDDNPWDEHFNRAPNCAFFTLIDQQPAPKKSGKAKVARPSKAASRLSIQSIATIATAASDLTSLGDVTATYDDSIVTTASTMPQVARKTTKAKKAPAPKGRKTKAKKNEPIEVLEDEPEVPEAVPAQKPSRGRKRGSDAMDDSEATNAEASAPKKRATRAKSVAPSEDTEMTDAPAKQPATKKKGRGTTAKTSRKVSQTSIKSQASAVPEAPAVPDDDEIDRQLEADLDRYDSEDDAIAADPETEKQRAQAPARGRPKKSVGPRKASLQSQKDISTTHAMFDANPIEPDEAEIEAEYQALHAEVEPEQPETLAVPKKGRKAGTRKVSKQAKKAKESEPPTEPMDEDMDELSASIGDVQYPALRMEEYAQPEPEAAEDADVSTGSVATKAESEPLVLPKRGRGRPSKKSLELRASLESMQQEQQQKRQLVRKEEPVAEPAEPEVSRTRGSLARESLPRASLSSSAKAAPVSAAKKITPPPSKTPTPVTAPTAAPTPARVQVTPARKDKSLPPPPPSSVSQPPTTPRRRSQPSRSAKQAAISPSQSPQSSDAENQRPAAVKSSSSVVAPSSVISKRPALAPVAMTPQRNNSPSRRNAVAGLQSTTPWRPADLDLMFTPAPNSENKENGVARLLYKAGDLASPERMMTVEEWIYHNAGLAEQKLKFECEQMVGAFEREGTRAMRVLEGLIVE
ncbi:hypothetical protein QBC38DRAFT_479729 [Podospora fimiseda]|uniref:Uncharacterized protein n=1 Tax=Podospora fimiseda TaxID=252190 RepID=A0AAN7H3D5_9PEZI|nr:hypothetical protein QBC38DRAFT_479729 [Podospora fimiseda]